MDSWLFLSSTENCRTRTKRLGRRGQLTSYYHNLKSVSSLITLLNRAGKKSLSQLVKHKLQPRCLWKGECNAPRVGWTRYLGSEISKALVLAQACIASKLTHSCSYDRCAHGIRRSGIQSYVVMVISARHISSWRMASRQWSDTSQSFFVAPTFSPILTNVLDFRDVTFRDGVIFWVKIMPYVFL